MLPDGLYERVIDRELQEKLEALQRDKEVGNLDSGDSHIALARHLQSILESVLDAVDKNEQVDTANHIIELLRSRLPRAARHLTPITPRMLLEVRKKDQSSCIRPSTGLVSSSLLTGASCEPAFSTLLSQELQSADRVDILCAFVKWSGIRLLLDDLRRFCNTHINSSEPVLRLITTTYTGATQARAVSEITKLPCSSVRISYDTLSTRLHAKAYLFHRDSGFSTAYVGSSNLSSAALTDGLEWNTRICQAETPHLWQKVMDTFESHWQSADMLPYTSQDEERLSSALVRERGTGKTEEQAFHFEIRPYPYQQEVLDQLEAERYLRGYWKNLVAAATGTGKTVIAALDYKRFAQGRQPRLLFVAHREEILSQSRDCFRTVLQDYNFGELMVGENTAGSFDHLFVSIQSFNSRQLHNKLDPNFYDYIVVDEFHHAAAESYKILLNHFKPKILLGLTATPERHDGLNILHFFEGRIAAEIRLCTAINRGLLAPFQYFGIADSVQLTNVKWKTGGYDTSELSKLYNENNERAELIVREVNKKILDPRKARGLGFCVSVRHAEFMAEYFNKCGIPSAALSAKTPDAERKKVRLQLRGQEINFLFVVDLFNEGVDLPEVDTVLFLRPTESLTVFLQQLGRGLRLNEQKECLTVLDFIGGAHRSFRFDLRFAALTGRPMGCIQQDLKNNLPYLPSGCSIRLEKQAMEHVLNNVQNALNTSSLTQCVREFEQETGKPLHLQTFVEHHNIDLQTIYKSARNWRRVKDKAFGHVREESDEEKRMGDRLCRLTHMDAPAHLKRLLNWLKHGIHTQAGTEDKQLQTSIVMLYSVLFGDKQPGSIHEAHRMLLHSPHILEELQELLALRLNSVTEVPPALELPFFSGLELHARYMRDELLAGLGAWTLENPKEVREGVYYNAQQQYDLFFVTLNKAESDYSPTTMYQDYAINERFFHWQSQSTTSPDSATGRRYQQLASPAATILLAVRENKNVNNAAVPYWFLGPARYVSHTGSRPMSLLLELQHPIPARLQPALCRMILT